MPEQGIHNYVIPLQLDSSLYLFVIMLFHAFIFCYNCVYMSTCLYPSTPAQNHSCLWVAVGSPWGNTPQFTLHRLRCSYARGPMVIDRIVNRKKYAMHSMNRWWRACHSSTPSFTDCNALWENSIMRSPNDGEDGGGGQAL